MKPIYPACAAAAAFLLATAAGAETPRIVDVATEKAGGAWTVHVTLAHPDTGWDHYADGWAVTDAAGNRLGFRELMHPHVTEQPFTRSLRGVAVPEGATRIFIRARCSVDGWAGDPVAVELSP
jgi:hypothetical protein